MFIVFTAVVSTVIILLIRFSRGYDIALAIVIHVYIYFTYAIIMNMVIF